MLAEGSPEMYRAGMLRSGFSAMNVIFAIIPATIG
jgi:hypothetical protein